MTVSYSTIMGISQPDAMAELLGRDIIGPVHPSVQVKKVRNRPGRRFEAPRVLWNVYEATLELPGGLEATKLFWTKTFFDDEECQKYRSRLDRLLSRHNGNPLDPSGYARFLPELNLFLFFFPIDPIFSSLGMFFDPARALPVLEPHFAAVRPGIKIQSLSCERIKYLPEISLIVRFVAQTTEGDTVTIYGKFQHSRRGALTYDVMRALWELPARKNGDLIVARPLAYLPKYDLLLQSELPGEEVKGDRHSDAFLRQCDAAGRALGHIHKSGITVGNPHTLDVEFYRLFDRLEQFKMSSPRVYMTLRSLLTQIRSKAERIPPEPSVPSHGDYKYNQFLYDGNEFGLIDVEYFVQAEPSFDLGKYCGHLIPSMPKHWSDTAQANEGRRIFLDGYIAVRPEYDGRRFSVYEALSLATRALVVTLSQPSNWEHTADTLLALGLERLKTRWGE
jgi:hypothetical protein